MARLEDTLTEMETLPDCSKSRAHELAMDWQQQAFPGAADGLKTGIVSREAAITLMREAALEHYPDCICAFGHGSALSGQFGPFSDLDVIVFRQAGGHWGHQCVMHGGFLVEFTFYTLDSLAMLTFMAAHLRKPLALCAADAVTLIDQNGAAEGIKATLKSALVAGPSAPSKVILDRLRLELTALAIDLDRQSDPSQVMAAALSNYPMLIKAINIQMARWDYSAKVLAKSSDEPMKAPLDALHAGIAALVQNEREPLRDIVRSLLTSFGGALKAGFTATYPLRPEILEATKAVLDVEAMG